MTRWRIVAAAALVSLAACSTEPSTAFEPAAPAMSRGGNSNDGKLQDWSTTQSGPLLTIDFRIVGLGSRNGQTLYVAPNQVSATGYVECRNGSGRVMRKSVSGITTTSSSTTATINENGNASGSVTVLASLPQPAESYCPTGHSATAYYAFSVGTLPVVWQFLPFYPV